MNTRSRFPFSVVLLALLAALVSPLAASAMPHFSTFDTVRIDPPQAAGGGGDSLSSILPLLLLFHEEPSENAVGLRLELRGFGSATQAGMGRFEACERPPAHGEGWSWGKKSRGRVLAQRDGSRTLQVFAQGGRTCRIELAVPAAAIADLEQSAREDRRRRPKPREIVVVGSLTAPSAR